MKADLSGKRILVTGGTGFIGTRLVERLYRDHGVTARVLVRDLTRVPRIARLPIEIAAGDVLDRPAVDRAMEGCDIVFHCAYGNRGPRDVRWRINVDGTRNVLNAASNAGVERFLHVSTFAVYGHPPDGELDEGAPRQFCDDDYADSKLQAERLVFEHSRRTGLPVVVIQPTVVYGPYAPSWTMSVINRLKSGRVILLNGGDGLCNAVYIDDVANALLLAASEEKAVGEAFLISAEEPITWRTFYERFEEMVDGSRTVVMTTSEALAHAKEVKRKHALPRQLVSFMRGDPRLLSLVLGSSEATRLSTLVPPAMRKLARRTAKSLVAKGRSSLVQGTSSAGLPIHSLSPWAIRRFGSKVRVRIDKAKRLLGYEPSFTFESGMKLTEQWARWANIIGHDGSPGGVS